MKVDLPKNRDFPIIIRPYPKIMAFYTILFWCSLQNQRKTEKKKRVLREIVDTPGPTLSIKTFFVLFFFTVFWQFC